MLAIIWIALNRWRGGFRSILLAVVPGTDLQILSSFFIFDVELRGLSKHTQDEYYFRVTSGSVNSYNSGLRFLYGVTLGVNLNLRQIPRHRKTRKFPDILTQAEVQNLFDACDNLRDKAILMTIYGAGLRVSSDISTTCFYLHLLKIEGYSISKRQMKQLTDMVWLEGAYNIVFLGPPGVGKSQVLHFY